MALIPSAQYGAQIDTSDLVGYPLGKARNDIVTGDGNGTPLEKAWLSDLWGWQQALLADAGVAASGDPDKVGESQYLQALKALFLSLVGGEATYLDASGAAVPKTRTTVADVNQLRAGDGYTKSSHFAGSVNLASNDGNYYLPLPRLPSGAVITGINVLVDPGAARPTLTDRVSVLLTRDNFTFSPPATAPETQFTPAVSNSNADDGTANLQVISITYGSPGSDVIVDGRPIQLTIIAGSNAASNNDKIHGVAITWTDPGPRNY